MLEGTAPWEVCIRPLRIVAKDQLLRSLRNRVFAWEPGQMGEDQLPLRFKPSFNQGNHALDVEVEPTLPATNNVEGLRGKLRLFCCTGQKADSERWAAARHPYSGSRLAPCQRPAEGASRWRAGEAGGGSRWRREKSALKFLYSILMLSPYPGLVLYV